MTSGPIPAPESELPGANAWWSFSGSAGYALCQWGMLVALAKLGTPRVVGQFALGLAVSAPVFLLANLQVRAIQATDTSQEYSFGDYLGLRLATTIAALIVVCALALSGFGGERVSAVIAGVALAKGFEAISDIFHGDLQRRERMDSIARYLAIKGAGSVLALALAVRLMHSAASAALAMAGVFAIVLWFGEARFAVNDPTPRWNASALRRLAITAFPLGSAMMLISLSSNMPRYFIDRSMGAEALGVFAALTSVSLAGGIAINAVGAAEMPRLARFFAIADRRAFWRLLGRIGVVASALAIAGVLVIVVAGRPILRLLFGDLYAAQADVNQGSVAMWIMAAGGVTGCASVLGYGLTAARCFRPQLPLFAGVALVAGVSSFVLIPRHGLAGAAMSQIVTAGAQLLGSAAVLGYAAQRTKEVSVPGPVRVLQCLRIMNRAGLESWLMHLLRRLDRAEIAMDFLVQTEESGAYDHEIRAIGGGIFSCPHPDRPWRYARTFRRILREHGPYDVVHSQNYFFAGVDLRIAAKAGVGTRIAHIHPVFDLRDREPLRKLYRRLMTHWIGKYATLVVAPSEATLDAYVHYGGDPATPRQVIHNCVDLSAYRGPFDREAARRQFGLPLDCPVIVYVARFEPHKNHALLIEIANRLLLCGNRVHFAVAGTDGSSRAAFAERIAGRTDFSLFVDLPDIAPLIRCADLFLFPSIEEGFGIVAIEAAAAGLPVVATDLPGIREACAPSHREFLFPANDAGAASRAVRAILGNPKTARTLGDAARVWAEQFTIDAALDSVRKIYGVGKAA